MKKDNQILPKQVRMGFERTLKFRQNIYRRKNM